MDGKNGNLFEIFALNHPAGSLGKQLTMTALDLILPSKDLQNLYPSSSFSEVISSLTKGGSVAFCRR